MTFKNKRDSCYYSYSCPFDKCSSCEDYEEVDLDEGYYGSDQWKEMKKIRNGRTI